MRRPCEGERATYCWFLSCSVEAIVLSAHQGLPFRCRWCLILCVTVSELGEHIRLLTHWLVRGFVTYVGDISSVTRTESVAVVP